MPWMMSCSFFSQLLYFRSKYIYIVYILHHYFIQKIYFVHVYTTKNIFYCMSRVASVDTSMYVETTSTINSSMVLVHQTSKVYLD
jgi:hypothetical protein